MGDDLGLATLGEGGGFSLGVAGGGLLGNLLLTVEDRAPMPTGGLGTLFWLREGLTGGNSEGLIGGKPGLTGLPTKVWDLAIFGLRAVDS